MATQKISVTLAAESIERARQTAGPRGLSSYLDSALVEKLERDEKRQALIDYLDELDAQDPAPDATKRRARRRADQIRVAASS